MHYFATVNQPGYLPESDIDLPVFDTPAEAWEYLLEERKRFEEDSEELAEHPQYTHVVDALRLLAAQDGTSTEEALGQVMQLWLATSQEFSYAINPDRTGHVIGVQTFDPESHLLPYVYTVDIIEDDEL